MSETASRRLQRHSMSLSNGGRSESGSGGILDSSENLSCAEDFGAASSECGSDLSAYRLSKGASVGAMLLEKELEERNSGASFHKQMPGLVLFPVWLGIYGLICLMSQKISEKLYKDFEKREVQSQTDLESARFVYWLAIASFACINMMQWAFLAFQISTKKRILGSMVMFINLVATTVYFSHIFEWVAFIPDAYGREIQIARFVEWMTTTPTMLIVLAASGNSMSRSVIKDWKTTLTTIVWDEVMLISGVVHSMSDPWSLRGNLLLAFACFCLTQVFSGVRTIIRSSIQRAATTYEVQSLKALEWFTYILWCFFPVVHILFTFGQISWVQYEFGTTFIDVLAKSVYAVTLLTGNFCLLDVISTLRIAQMRAERDDKRSQIIRSEAINEALQSAALEAEASARLSRRFLANVSAQTPIPAPLKAP
jgi:bacteriorhodopsin